METLQIQKKSGFKNSFSVEHFYDSVVFQLYRNSYILYQTHKSSDLQLIENKKELSDGYSLMLLQTEVTSANDL